MTMSRTRKWGILLTCAILCGIIAGQSIPQGNSKAVANAPLDPDSMEAIVGLNRPIARNANPMAASVAEALQRKDRSERLSAMIIPSRFDSQAFARDSKSYLNTVEPGRIWQAAQPAEGVAQAIPVSPEYVEVLQGEPVALTVKAAPNAPVTFTSFDLGAFSNGLTSITVAADEKGIAIAPFTGTRGTYNECNILAASPLTSGQVKFVVNVIVPELKRREARSMGRGG